MFVKVPHALMSYGLSSNALKVYLYLSACCGNRGSVAVRYNTIADRCHIHKDTAASSVKTLESCGLLQLEHRYLDGQYIANRYKLTPLAGKWFALDLSINPFALPAAAFGVYLCIRRCANRKGRAFPSYAAISKMLGGRAKATISNGIQLLERLGLVVRMAYRAGKHNLYVLGTKKQQAQESSHACCHSQCTVSPQYSLSLSVSTAIVNSFDRGCSDRGCSIFRKHCIDPPCLTIQKKDINTYCKLRYSIKEITYCLYLCRPPPSFQHLFPKNIEN